MEEHENVNKEKAEFYFKNKIKIHVSLTSKEFLNGFFESELIDKIYFWFIDDKDGRVRLFLKEIYDLTDFKEASK
ncbi:MAG: hypothetical protein KKB31_05500 [Nanoarchaeota archaeon]|nr:hypothetical protein [Nanoarchaeota archaeon]